MLGATGLFGGNGPPILAYRFEDGWTSPQRSSRAMVARKRQPHVGDLGYETHCILRRSHRKHCGAAERQHVPERFGCEQPVSRLKIPRFIPLLFARRASRAGGAECNDAEGLRPNAFIRFPLRHFAGKHWKSQEHRHAPHNEISDDVPRMPR